MNTRNEMLALATLADPRWAAVAARDRAADGSFFYSVRTTGVYCRPSCAARLARPENVAFHATAAEAERGRLSALQALQAGPAVAGRAARRDGRRGLPLHRSAPRRRRRSTELAERAGLSAFHFHRVFKAVTGLTPKAYAAAHRAGRVRDELARQRHA